jgi:hypothetical protein
MGAPSEELCNWGRDGGQAGIASRARAFEVRDRALRARGPKRGGGLCALITSLLLLLRLHRLRCDLGLVASHVAIVAQHQSRHA